MDTMKIEIKDEPIDEIHITWSAEEPGVADSGGMCCRVDEILRRGFSSYNYAERKDIISKGRETPSLRNLITTLKTCERKFNPQMYEKVEWITGCESKAKLFCWPCLLFSREKSAWTSTGVSDINNLYKKIKGHSSSQSHLNSIFKLKTYSPEEKLINCALDEQIKISNQKHNETVRRNHELLKKLIDVVCFLGFHELCFQSHEESFDSTNKGNFKGLVNLMAKYDPLLSDHLEDSPLFIGASNLIQNDIISSVVNVYLENIKQEINNSTFVAVVLGGNTDVGYLNQLSKVVRYVNQKGNLEERFLGFQDFTLVRTAEALCRIVTDIVEDLKCDSKLIAHSYDGALVTASHLSELQVRVKQMYPKALFVHCFAHRLNIVLSQSLSRIKECNIFFSTLTGLSKFFLQSPKRCHALNKEVKKSLSKAVPVSWNDDSKLVQTVYEYYKPLMNLFENIVEDNGAWDAETLTLSRGFLELLRRDFSFNFLINLLYEIFPLTENLFNILLSKNNISFCVDQINLLQNIIKEKRDCFDRVWNKAESIEGISEPRCKRLCLDNTGDIKKSYHTLFCKIIDNILEELNSRFCNFEWLRFLELAAFENYCEVPFPRDALDSLLCSYDTFFDEVSLRSELSVIYSVTDGIRKKNIEELSCFIRENDLEKAFGEVLKLCELVMTIPATIASVEQGFSTLKRVQTFLRNSTSQTGLSNLAIFSVEKSFIKTLSENRKFYDNVIADFAKQDRGIALHYK